jgi:hypothetical protein
MRKSIEQKVQKKVPKKSSKWELEHYRVIRAKIGWAQWLAVLAEGYAIVGQPEKELEVLA